MVATVTHEKVGHTGQGLWKHKGWQLPALVQHVANDLIHERGMTESHAVEMAVGIVKNWAHGHDGHGHKVHPDTQAKAIAAVAEWEKLKARTHAGRSAVSDDGQRAEMSSKSINDLPDSAFAYIESGGKKDAEGKTTPRSKRHFPIHDAAHVRNALSRAPQSPFGDKAMPKIRAAAKKFGVQMSDSSARAEFLRFYPLEDIHIVRSADGGGDGRVVEAYAAVFDQEAEIQDHEGHYLETIDRAAFNRVIDHIQRSRSGLSAIKVLYNHGMTIGGTPSDRFSLPIGVPVEIRAEQRGLLTRTRYNATPLGEEVLELVRSESITSQSFTGRIVKSDPPLRRGSRRQPAGGELPQVKRMELGLREYGPVLWPAYTGAEILGVRMSTPGSWEPDSNENEGTSTDVEPAADDSLEVDEHSARYHQHALYRMRTEELCKASGITLPRWEQEEADK